MKQPKIRWMEGTRMDYFHTAANILGFPNAPLAWGLSNVKWNSKDELIQVAQALALPAEARAGGEQ